VKSSIDNLDDGAAYRDAWIGLQNKYLLLERFVGGLATISPGTSTVESDLSVVKYEKNKNRMSLTDASLEGIFRAKQYRRMLFWLAVLYIVVRLTFADSKAVLLAYYASLRLFSCSYFTYILRSAVAQPNLLARRSRPLMSGLPRRRRGRG
jgi:hypothetical protein